MICGIYLNRTQVTFIQIIIIHQGDKTLNILDQMMHLIKRFIETRLIKLPKSLAVENRQRLELLLEERRLRWRRYLAKRELQLEHSDPRQLGRQLAQLARPAALPPCSAPARPRLRSPAAPQPPRRRWSSRPCWTNLRSPSGMGRCTASAS